MSPLALPLCLAKTETTPCFKSHIHPAKEKLFGSAWLRSAAFGGVTVGAGEMVSPVPGLVVCHAWDAPVGCEAGSAGRSLWKHLRISEEKEALVHQGFNWE